eukprot:Protomagalhaensia_sp_Gyna_25__3603@NODE_323_length_3878_cov_226_857254_g253_i0_p1_GENE_NODE_323_length_3878_cov_226_857254_g253_i0NODE_323_length_3878_cov_226_857254_g253_i0_p1_ORF_typecomplete_len443_score65_46Pkinase/PF00069_25/6e37Pkinase_Tyr/PF07714_17/1_1e22Pkinase_fungal/PF17667_1/3_1e06Kinaselike/PF14531_6/4_1e05Kdo/PF06293_14/2_9e03Kdo/PF06293_14/2_1e03Kdo/PF06293_14/0_00032APH/PF01636_23/0_22_NODE_323_length_3878_cov_226_857254_g253_i024453773
MMRAKQESRIKELAARFCARSRDEGPPSMMSKGFDGRASQAESIKTQNSVLSQEMQQRYQEMERRLLLLIHQAALNRYLASDLRTRLITVTAGTTRHIPTRHWSRRVTDHLYVRIARLIKQDFMPASPPRVLLPLVRIKANKPYFMLQAIGKGGFAQVVQVVNAETWVKYAAKLTQLMSTGDSDTDQGAKWMLQSLLREIMTMKNETHPNVLLLHDYFAWAAEGGASRGIVTILDLCAGDLTKFAAKASISQRKLWMKDLLRGLDHLHRTRGILHMDIKVQNLLVSLDESRRLKIADLGLCREMVENENGGLELHVDCSMSLSWVGTLINQPPEYLQALLTGTEKMITNYSFDIWSAGLVAYYLFLSPAHPFTPHGIRRNSGALVDPPELATKILERITECLEMWKQNLNRFPEMEFVEFLLTESASGRPTAHQCLSHAFLC